MLTQMSPMQENIYDFKEGVSSVDPNCVVEKLSLSLQSCEPFCITDIDSSKSLFAPDISRTDVLAGAFNSISIDKSSGLRENEGKDKIRLNDTSETKCPDIIRASPWRRRTFMSKSNQKTDTKKAARKCRKIADKKPLLDLIFLRVERRRRSSFCKRGRSSAWGLLGNIAKVLELNAGLDVSQNEHKKSRKARGNRGDGKRNMNQTGQTLQRSKGESRASTSCIRLKVKLAKEVSQSCLMDMVPSIDNNLEKYWGTRKEPKLTMDIESKLAEEMPRSTGFQCCSGNLEKAMMLSDASVLDMCAGSGADIHQGILSQEVVEGLGVTVDNCCLDPGTSPDSEVINLIPEAQISGKVPEDLPEVLISSQDCVARGDVTSLTLPPKKNKEDKLLQAGNCSVEDRFPSPGISNIASLFKKYGQEEKMGDGSYSCKASISTTTGNAAGNVSSSDGFSMELLPSSSVTDFGVSIETLKVERGVEADLCSGLGVVGLESPESLISEKLLPSTIPKNRKLPKSSRSRGVRNIKSEIPDYVSRRGNACKPKGNQTNSVNKCDVKEKGDGGQVVCKVESYPETGNYTLDGRRETETGGRSTTGDESNLDMVLSGVGDKYVSPRNAWVRCDDCYKWRRIAAVLADSIEETNCRWICKDNAYKDFAACSIPQEKSNAEINAELEISDASCEEDGCDARLNSNRMGKKKSTVSQQSSWKLIKSNLFLHRSRKTQTIDEIMVCHCKAPLDGRMGCRGGCLNRMLNIECVKGTCPCGEHCSNQQFQKRKYAKLKCFRYGKKGYGLQLLEDIPKGQFLIEYVGEVLDMHAYEARQREYASKGHKHFYFMTLNGSEVIDACAKGNLGRFINHSCEPNCRTEKWMVNGEVCIGLFAMRDIKKGEEVTFDYNYVRVFGAAAKICICGSSQCRGYIGGDPLNAEAVVQGDSDEEYPEPVMVCEDGDNNLDNLLSGTSSFDGTEMQTVENPLTNKDEIDKPATAVGHLKITKEILTAENEESLKILSAASKVEISSEMEGSVRQSPFSVQLIETSLQPDDGKSEITSAAQQEFSVSEETTNISEETSLTTMMSKSLPDTLDIKRKSKSDTKDRHVVSKSSSLVKTSRSSSSVKKGKSKNNAVNGNIPTEMDSKSHVVPYRSKKLLEGSSNGRFEAVQEKLNELLDVEGGISKRKDASRGYLKLLFLTAASGDSGNGEAIQSNRDLSMILDALLKTKSRTVLVDIINKNGLQMLHNIMKRYRKEFNKIPILRKLLKVLEYLAGREILTLEHINRSPTCPGVESFKESILTFTEHIDKQVHQIARSFRDRWIPRPVRKNNCMDRDIGRMEFHRGSSCNRFSASHNQLCGLGRRPMEAINCIEQSVIATTPVSAGILEGCSTSCTDSCIPIGTKTRKRKSRWDQPGETNPDLISPRRKELGIQPSLSQKSYSSSQPEIGEVVLDHITAMNCDQQNITSDGKQKVDEDVPPGFSSHFSGPLIPSNASSTSIDLHEGNGCRVKCPSEVAMGHPQERFISRLSVSYGIPLSVIQQFGIPQVETVESWIVAPGMPFLPFPPLPQYPREKREIPPAVNSMTMNLAAGKNEQDFPNPTTNYSDQNTPSTSGASPPDVEILGAHNRRNIQRVRGSSNSLGRKYFRQQKWNNSRFGPPWFRENDWGFKGNSLGSGTCRIDVGSRENEPKGSYGSEEVSIGVETYGNTFYQHPQHQN